MVDELPSLLTGPGTEVYDVIAPPDDLRIVLHYYDRVTQVPEGVENLDQAVAVSGVQPDARLIEDI